MSRIRTVKPSLFRHERLYEAEKATGLPLRFAFPGLLTVADREGRFKWRPRELKLDCLPYDDLDFAEVLDAFVIYDFIIKYEVDGEIYGVIPSFVKHQVVNQREAKSEIPPPTEGTILHVHAHASTDDAPHENVHAHGEGKGKEVKGKEEGKEESSSALRADDAPVSDACFDGFWALYPHKVGKLDARKAFAKAQKVVSFDQLIAGLRAYVNKTDDRPWCNPATWLNEGRWDDQPAFPPQPRSGSKPNSTVQAANRIFERTYGSAETAKAA